MKKITLLIFMIFASYWQGHSQVTVGTGTYTSAFNTYPFNPYYGFSYAQSIYLASEINASGDITAISFEMADADAIPNSDDEIDLWIGHTTKTDFTSTTDWVPVASLTQVLTNGSLTKSGTTITFTFSVPYSYNGTDNLLIALDANESDYDTSSDVLIGTNVGTGVNRTLRYMNDTTNPDPLAPVAGVRTNYVGNITFFGITQSCPLPTALTASNITTTSADLSWTEGGTSTNWDIEWGADGFTPTGTPNVNDTADNPYELTGLSVDTDYDFYVRSDCGADDTTDTSAWVGPFSFSTQVACPAPTTLTASNITTTSADLGWTEGGTSTNWDIEWGVDGFTPTETPNVNDTGDNPYELTGLTANTAYDFYVRADCGADNTDVSTWSGPFGFTTACDAFGDFTEGFESYGTTQDPNCWSENLGGSAGYVYTSSSDTNTGVRALRTGNSGTASAVHYIISPQLVDMSAGTHRLSFFLEASANIASIEVGRMTDSESSATFTVEEAISWTTTMAQKTVYFDTPSSDNYFAIRVTFGTGTFSYASFDDFVWEPSPSCIEPSSLTATNFTPTSADLGWTENGSATAWDIEWGLDGFTPTGTPNVNDTGNNPYNLGGLAANTDYEFYVRADCGSDNTDVSVWSGPFGFTTECDVFTPEYNADMSLNVPECWKEANNGDAASGPSEFGAGLWFASNHNGTPSNVINLFSDVRSDWIISPVFDLSSAAPSELRVYVALTESTTSGSGADLGSDDEVSLLMTTDGGTSWTALQSWTQGNVPTDVGEQITYDLSAITGNVQFAFLGDEGSVNDTEDVYFHVSQFQVRETPACIEPSVLTVANITPTSADLGWTENGSATAWDIEWGLDGFTPTGTPNVNDTGNNPYNLGGLAANTDYEFYVRADCGSDNTDVSVWSGPFSFTTLCNPETVFPSTTDFTNNPPTSCWSEAGSGEVADGPSGLGASDWKAGRAYTDASAVVINSNVINLYQSVDREWLISPVYDIPVGIPHSLVVNVAVTNYQFSGTSDDTDTDTMGSDDEVQLLQSIDGGTTWTNITTWNVGNQPAVTGTEFIADLTAVSGTIQFALWASDGTVDDTEDYDFHIGEFTVIDNATLTIEENEVFAGFKYFPNPVKGTLSLRAQNAIQNVSIYNLLGQEVLRTSPNALNSEIDMASLQTGAYFVKVTINDATETIRVIKQ